MDYIKEYLEKIDNHDHLLTLENFYQWIQEKFSDLAIKIAWNQPMFTHHETFIIALSATKTHISIAPEAVAVTLFKDKALSIGYTCTKELIKIHWNKPVDYTLLEDIINFNIEAKKDVTTFWRK